MARQKTVIFLGDGMADEPIGRLGGKTPLEYAHTPAMDSIAAEGRNGTLLTLPEGYPTSSEVANMSVLGCDLALEYCGRGPLEAAGAGIELGPDDKAFRMNFVTIVDGILRDYSAGQLCQEAADELIQVMNEKFGAEDIRFHSGSNYRALMVVSGDRFSHKVKTEKPDDHQGDRVEDFLPSALDEEARETADLITRLMLEAGEILESASVNRHLAAQGKSMANGVWPWNGGTAANLRPLSEKYGISGAVISAVKVIEGLGRCLGMEVIRVEGATGYIDTNFEGKADAALDALNRHDLVYLHVEGIDEVSHERNLDAKVKAIEDFDARCVGRVINGMPGDYNAAVLPDHPVPIALGKHTRRPVPVAVRMASFTADAIEAFSENLAPGGALGAMKNGDLMNLLFKRP